MRIITVSCHRATISKILKIYIAIITLLISPFAKGQDTEVFKRIDSIVANVDFMASKGTWDTLKTGLLNGGGTTSDVFILKHGGIVQKIFIINNSTNNREKMIFQNGKPLFMQFSQPDSAQWTFYLVGEDAYFKDSAKFNKGSSKYWYDRIDFYLNLLKD
jgi:hypothetical protein